MAAKSVPRTNEIYMGGKFWNVLGPVRLTNITVPPNPIVFGDTEKQGTTQVMQQFTQSNNIGGSGRHIGNVRTDATRNWTSDCDTRWSNLLTLKPKAVVIGKPAQAAGGCKLAIEYRGSEYFIFAHANTSGDAMWLFQNDESGANNYWSSGGEIRLFGAAITDAIVFKDKLYVGRGVGYDYMNNAGAWTRDTTQPTGYLAVWDNKLWTIAATATGWTVYQSTDGVAWTAGASIDTGDRVTDLLRFRDTAGGSALCALTDRGLYIYDATAPRWNLSDAVWPRMPSTQNARGTVFRDGRLYVNIGDLTMIAIQPGTTFVITPVGLDLDDGVPSDEQGRIVELTSDINYVIASVDSTTDTTSASDDWYGSDAWEWEQWASISGKTGVRAYFGGWHKLYTTTQASYPSGRALDLSSAYDRRRLYFSLPSGVHYIDLGNGLYNPLFNPTLHFEDGPVSHTTPWWDYGTEGQLKNHGHLFLLTKDCSSTETILVEYAKDLDDSTWYPLTTITTNGVQELKPGDRAGDTARYFRYRFTLDRGSNDMLAPKMRYYQSDTMRLLPATYGYGVQLDLTRPCHGRSPAQQLRELQDLADASVTPNRYQLAYKIDASQDLQTLWGRITHLNGTEETDASRRGEGTWYVAFTVPYRGDNE